MTRLSSEAYATIEDCGWLASQTDMTATDWFVRDYAQNHQGPEHDAD